MFIYIIILFISHYVAKKELWYDFNLSVFLLI